MKKIIINKKWTSRGPIIVVSRRECDFKFIPPRRILLSDKNCRQKKEEEMTENNNRQVFLKNNFILFISFYFLHTSAM
jgi:chorismate-pyruvate lyase